jgi:hypothetical protein
MRTRLATSIAGMALVAAAPAVAGGSETGTSPVFSIGPGHTFIEFVPGARSRLVRTSNGVSVTLQTSQLPAGHAVTVWALIFNNPSACGPDGCDETQGDLGNPAVRGSLQRVAGHVVGETSSFAGHLAIGEASKTAFGPGLLNPYGAHINLIVREHGVAASGELLQQQFNNPSPRFCNVSCSDIQKSVHMPHR